MASMSNNNSKTKTVIAFDLYGTLLSTSSIAQKLATHFGESQAASVATVWRKYQLEYTWRLNSMKQYQPFSLITRQTLIHALLEHRLALSDADITKLMESYDSLSTFPDVSPALSQLSSNPEVECVVFSNGTKDMVTNSVHHSSDLSPHAAVFSQLVSVHEVQTFKPAPEVYRHLAQCVGMVGEESKVWLVSGNPFDVVGARAMGMQAAWVDREGNGWQDQLLGTRPTVVVRGLEDVATVVAEHAKKST